MARPRTNYCLPALPAALAGARPRTDGELLDLLRKIARENQREDSQTFYPLRDVARQLQVPPSAVARAYSALRKEGLLRTVRGSKTLLAGSRLGHRVAERTVVALPLSVSCFTTLHDYRAFTVHLSRELHACGFVAATIFVDDSQRALEDLRQELEQYGFETIVWFLPPLGARETVLRLRDKGARVVGVSDGGLPGTICRYEINRHDAVVRALEHWTNRLGITDIRIARTAKRPSADEERIEQAVAEFALAYEFVSLGHAPPAEFVASLCDEGTSGIILRGAPAAVLSMQAPAAFTRMLESCRVLLVDGLPALLAPPIPQAPADVLIVDWNFVAKAIVHDLVTQSAFEAREPTRFDAELRLHVPLRSCLTGRT
jgi:DNA-binding transcriptional ArsR family regulator